MGVLLEDIYGVIRDGVDLGPGIREEAPASYHLLQLFGISEIAPRVLGKVCPWAQSISAKLLTELQGRCNVSDHMFECVKYPAVTVFGIALYSKQWEI
jgi:hypothetical protein